MTRRKPKPATFVCPKCGHTEVQDTDLDPTGLTVTHLANELGRTERHLMELQS